MFLCVSPNPAMDTRVLVKELQPGQMHRIKSTCAQAGGKTAHVAMVLQTLGRTPLWIGFFGGETRGGLVSGPAPPVICGYTCPTRQQTRVPMEVILGSRRVTQL